LAEEPKPDDALLARQLSGLGYPGFVHLRPRKANPAAVVLAALLAYNQLCAAEQQLERARLVRQDTLCRESMPNAERRWLEANRSPLARHWNLLTGLTADQLSYAR
jgi:hypothetical protein